MYMALTLTTQYPPKARHVKKQEKFPCLSTLPILMQQLFFSNNYISAHKHSKASRLGLTFAQSFTHQARHQPHTRPLLPPVESSGARHKATRTSEVKMLTEWVIPEFGEFECDYVTSHWVSEELATG